MKSFILAIDQGTTATTVLLIDSSCNVVARESHEILPTYPNYGWVEHDLNSIWNGTARAIEKLFTNTKFAASNVAAIGITNQRETVGLWERSSGIPLAPAIVWQCRRTTERCAELKKQPGLEKKVRELTGLVLDPYFSSTKMEWLSKNVSGAAAKIRAGSAIFGNIDTFLLFKLSGGSAYATDVSNASRTMLMGLSTGTWDDSLLEVFGVPKTSLPEIQPSSGYFGQTKGLNFLPDGIPISGILGDQQAALFGQLCTETGITKCTYGTGSFVMANTGDKIIYSKHGMLSTAAWKIGNQITYALEGSAFVAGAAVQFLRDNLGIIKNSSEVEALAASVSSMEIGDLLFVPALTGLGAPYWNAEAKGVISGLTRGSNKSHIALATLEGIALQNNALFNALQEDLKPFSLSEIRVDGGASANNLLMQLQADLGKLKIIRPMVLDTTAMGSALAAGLGVGFWNSLQDLKASWKIDRSFSPQMNELERTRLSRKWDRAVAKIIEPPRD